MLYHEYGYLYVMLYVVRVLYDKNNLIRKCR